MPDHLILSFLSVSKSIVIILMVALVGGMLVRYKKISQKDIQSLSHVTVIVLLPSLIFSKIILYFKPSEFPFWWLLPIVAILMIMLGILISALLFGKEYKNKKAQMAVASFMNANYLVLPLGQMIFKDQFNQFAAYCFLFILGVSPFLWSVGKVMITNSSTKDLKVNNLLTPPFVANLIAVALVLLGLGNAIPDVVIKPISFMGEAAIPVATFILGATLGSISLRKFPPISEVFKVVSTKLFFIPLVVIIILYYSKLYIQYPLISDLLFIQSAVAPATQLIIQVRKYEGDAQTVGSHMFISYLLCILTLPVWWTFWKYLTL